MTKIKQKKPKQDTATEKTESQKLEDRNLRVELEVERGGPCVMDDIEGDITNVDVRLEGEKCRVDISVRRQTETGVETGTKQFTSDICTHCPGSVFPEYGCIPRYLRINKGSFVMETYVANTDAVASLVKDIRDRCERVSVRSIMSTDTEEYAEHCTVDLTSLTPKQREAVTVAQKQGYFDPDTRTELGEVANEMELSTSALSQRLQRAEANVMRQLTCECDCWSELL